MNNSDTLKKLPEEKQFDALLEILHNIRLNGIAFVKTNKFREQLAFGLDFNDAKAVVQVRLMAASILIYAYQATQDKNYLQQLSLFVNQQSVNQLVMSGLKNHSLSKGKSGILWLLLIAYPYLKEDWMLSSIEALLYSFLNGLRPHKKNSLVYISGEISIAPLCELDEGNSGMALIFMELGKFFNNADLLLISQKLLAYEDNLWNSETMGWPNFRKQITSFETYQTHKEKYLAKAYAYFKEPDTDLSFKTGTLGIAYTRLRAFEYTKYTKYIGYFKKAIQHLNVVVNNNSYKFTKQELLLLAALNDAGKNDLPKVFPPIKPLQDAKPLPLILILASQLHYPYFHTLNLLNRLSVKALNAFSAFVASNGDAKANLLKSFYTFLKEYLKKNKVQGSKQIKELVKLEYQKIKLQKTIKNSALLHIEEVLQIEQRAVLLKLDEDKLLKTPLLLNKKLVLIKTKWKWIEDEIEWFMNRFLPIENLQKEASDYYGVLLATSQFDAKRNTFVQEMPISEYEYIILDLFEYPVTVQEVVEEFSTLFEITSAAEYESVKNLVVKIAKDAIFNRFLVAA